MDSTTYSRKVAEKINTLRKTARLSVNGLAAQSAIPYSTLDRKLKGGGDFSVREIKEIATALNISAAELTVIYDESTAAVA